MEINELKPLVDSKLKEAKKLSETKSTLLECKKTGKLIVKAWHDMGCKSYLYEMPDGKCVQVVKNPMFGSSVSKYDSIKIFIDRCWFSIGSDMALLKALQRKFKQEDMKNA